MLHAYTDSLESSIDDSFFVDLRLTYRVVRVKQDAEVGMTQLVTSLGAKHDQVFQKAASYETPGYLVKMLRRRVPARLVRRRLDDMLRTAIRWVVAMDAFHETGDEEYNEIALAEREALNAFLNPVQQDEITRFEREMVRPYWFYEADLKTQIALENRFTERQIRSSLERRSSDALLYARLVSFVCPLPIGVTTAIHVRQALEDIDDCVDDYVEDLENGEPNIFFMYLLHQGVLKRDWPKTFQAFRDTFFYRLRINRQLRQTAKGLYDQVKEKPELASFPVLKKELEDEYARVIRLCAPT